MKQDKPQLLLKHYLKKLKLPTMLRDYEALAATCAKDNCDYVSFLLRLVEREALDREKRAAERRVKTARFPIIKTLDTFDFKAQPSIKQKLVRELMVGQYADRKENVLLVGNSGTGKTHLASALGFAGCMQGRKVRFFTAKALVTQLMAPKIRFRVHPAQRKENDGKNRSARTRNKRLSRRTKELEGVTPPTLFCVTKISTKNSSPNVETVG